MTSCLNADPTRDTDPDRAQDQSPDPKGGDRVALSSAQRPLHHCRGSDLIDATDRQIDQLVYELYGLTDDEIKIVEEATR